MNKLFLETLLELAADEAPAQTDVQPTEDTAAQTEVAEQTEQPVEQPASEFDIDGEKLTLEQIREYRKGYLRQSDYTKKTQELSKQRQDAKDALELYDYLKNNPDIAAKLTEVAPEDKKNIASSLNPAMERINNIEFQLKTTEIEKTLELISQRDPDVDEIAVLEIAQRENTSVDKAYKLWRADNFDNILAKKLADQSKQLTEKIQQNHGITKTLINTGDKTATTDLSQLEMDMADKLGMSYEDYAKWK